MTSKIECTPAQIDFLKSAISDFSVDTWKVELAGRAGSSRYFLRLSKKDRSFILVVWDSRDEDWPRFLQICRDLSPVVGFLPQIYKDDEVRGLILEEDLGDTTLKNLCLHKKRDHITLINSYRLVLDALFQWQNIKIDTSPVISARAMDLETFLWESWYFSHYCVTDFCGCEHLLDPSWENQRQLLAKEAASFPKVCIHRDFQSENVLIKDGMVRFVDYQGARLGPAGYDLASLLFDPYIDELDEDIVKKLYGYYCRLYTTGLDLREFYICAAQRLMQALGAYGNLSIHKGKNWYRDYIPLAFQRLSNIMINLPEYTAISKVVSGCRETLKY